MNEYSIFSLRAMPSKEDKANEKSFYEEPEAAAHTHGDGANFSGKPSSARGDIWQALDIDVDAFIPQCVNKGETVGPFKLPKSDIQVVYFDYPADTFSLWMRSLASKGEGNYAVVDIYPVMEGRQTEATLVAWYDVDGGTTGYISTRLPNGVAMDFFSPSYACMQAVFAQNTKYDIYISGVALQLKKVPSTEFEVTEGNFTKQSLRNSSTIIRTKPHPTSHRLLSAWLEELEECLQNIPVNGTCLAQWLKLKNTALNQFPTIVC